MARGRALMLPAALLLLLALAADGASMRGLAQAANGSTTDGNTSVAPGWYLGRASW
jgi:hypothetical protein